MRKLIQRSRMCWIGCCYRSPNQRYESAKAVLAALRQAVSSGAGASATPPPPSGSPARGIPRPCTTAMQSVSTGPNGPPSTPAPPVGLARPPKGPKPVKASSSASPAPQTAISSVSLVEFFGGCGVHRVEGGLVRDRDRQFARHHIVGQWCLVVAIGSVAPAASAANHRAV
jgi:hypothetical protein